MAYLIMSANYYHSKNDASKIEKICDDLADVLFDVFLEEIKKNEKE